MIKETWESRNIIKQLVKKEQIAEQKDTKLGGLWNLISPLAFLLIYALVFSAILKVESPPSASGKGNFGYYAFIALTLFNFFSSTTITGTNVLLANQGLLNRVNFPLQTPLIAKLATNYKQLGFETLVLLAMGTIITGLHPLMLLMIWPILMIGALTLGTIMWLAPLSVKYRDTSYLVEITTKILFWCTPIFYSLEIIPTTYKGMPLQTLIKLNPISSIIAMQRAFLYEHQLPEIDVVLSGSLIPIAALLIGTKMFKHNTKNLREQL